MESAGRLSLATLATALHGVAVAATLAGVALLWLRPVAARRGRALSPLAGLGVVVALLAVNQILCAAYVVAAHGGDAGFITRWLGPGWFAIVRGPAVAALGRALPRWLLAPTVLRVQAVLELPFVLFAYAAVAATLSRRLLSTLLSPWVLWPAAAAFSATFIIVELAIPNPFTGDDVVLRVISFAVMTPLSGWLMRGPAPEEAAVGVVGVAGKALAAAALMMGVLVAYDTLLLYNLAHLGFLWPLVLALAALVGVGWALGRVAGVASPALTLLVDGVERFALAFFVPSLSLRYSLRWGGTAWLAALLGAATLAVTLWRAPAGAARVALGVAAVAAVGAVLATGGLGARWMISPELRLLRAAAVAATTLIVVLAIGERLLRRR